jgi:hypothetical protein
MMHKYKEIVCIASQNSPPLQLHKHVGHLSYPRASMPGHLMPVAGRPHKDFATQISEAAFWDPVKEFVRRRFSTIAYN